MDDDSNWNFHSVHSLGEYWKGNMPECSKDSNFTVHYVGESKA